MNDQQTKITNASYDPIPVKITSNADSTGWMWMIIFLILVLARCPDSECPDTQPRLPNPITGTCETETPLQVVDGVALCICPTE